MAYSIKEVVIEDRVVSWAERHGWLVEKVKFANAGYPDRFFLHISGVPVFIEFKKVGEEPDPLQDYRIKVLTSRGIRATWTDSYDDAVAFLTASLPDKSNEAHVGAGVRGVVLGSGFREDRLRAQLIHDTAQKGSGEKDASDSSPEASIQGVARRD